ncbi:Response regulator receiver domain-containing protein [Pedobacter terrae]|uniref:Response regulator receiver domain-containing protein n=1 Tax=Pedobacter terrae TaxID=405671 RepID=A0A1G7WL69_9SPHI|nr:response regulator [Pedobacter terrae]SDG72737.1 Response regulator receiver domain-containing protein [Pedobacter terrae]
MRKKVVLLEDNESIRDMLKFLLEDENFQVMEYASIASFMAAAANSPTDLFLLDVIGGRKRFRAMQ